MKTIDEALEFIHGASKFGIKLGLSGIQEILDGIGNPEKKLKFIHVAGTNGKGSVSTFIAQCLIEAGYNVGKYTSPHISSFNERINLNGKDISDEDLIMSASKVKIVVDMLKAKHKNPTEFEIITAIALDYFSFKKTDIVVLETGLGGRLDSTNVVTPILSVITKIALDHTDRLGETLSEIAMEKAGIIKHKVPVCVGLQDEEAINVIRKKAGEMSSEVFELQENDIITKELNLDFSTFMYKNQNFRIGMLGKYQIVNAALAILSLSVIDENTDYKIPISAIKSGLESSRWQGRFELISRKPLLIADGAHNMNGIIALKESIKTYFGDKKLKAIFAVMRDKDVMSMLDEIGELFDEFYLYTAEVERAMPNKDIANILRFSNFKGKTVLVENMTEMLDNLHEKDIYVAFGSLYFISEIKEMIKKNNYRYH